MKKTIKRVLVLFLGIILGLSSFMSREIFKETNLYSNKNSHIQIANGVIPPPMTQSLVFGTNAGPLDLDPHLIHDLSSQDVISQICEGLYKFNTTDPSYSLIPVLATALPTVTPDGLNITIPLRTGVTFTDGTPFNATVVKWNFDRLNYFLNYSGNWYLPAPFNVPLPSDGSIPRTYVWTLFTLGGVPVINRTEIIDLYTVKIVMNLPKASFINLLTFHATFFHSPTSAQNQGKELDYLTYADGDVLIGTGPFIFQSYITDIEVNFTPFADYWMGPTNLTSLTFAIIADEIARNNALLSGDIDILDFPVPAYLDQFTADPDIEIVNVGSTQSILWCSFNYNSIPFVARKAISYSLDYSYVTDVIYDRLAIRLLSPIPEGIMYSNYSYDCPVFDRTIARQTIIDADFGGAVSTHGLSMASTDTAWRAVATGGTPLVSLNATWNSESIDRGIILNRLAFDMEFIGMELNVYSVAWSILIAMSRDEPWRLELFTMGWAPDYFDPENFINPEWSNVSSMNGGEYYEPDVQVLMDQGLVETDPVAREAIYQEIQQKMIERDMPAIWIRTYANWDAWRKEVKGWVPNAINRLDFYPVYLDIPDLIAPTIAINYPTPNQLCGITAPNFSIQIIEPNLYQKLYSLNGRPNITFTTETQLNQTEWNNIGNGTVSIIFYAIDGAGNANSSEVIVRKDAIIPDITINSPIADEVFTEPPEFTISIIEEDLVSTWYTVEGSITQYPITGLTGTINQDAWDDVDYGEIIITYYAEDGAGNIGNESVTVIKSQPYVPEIPGYYLFILLSIFFIALISITRKRKIIRKK